MSNLEPRSPRKLVINSSSSHYNKLTNGISCQSYFDTLQELFKISQSAPFPQTVVQLLEAKRNRTLVDRETKSIYESLREECVFEKINSPRLLMELIQNLSLVTKRRGLIFHADYHSYGCWILLSGTVQVCASKQSISVGQDLENLSVPAHDYQLQRKMKIGEIIHPGSCRGERYYGLTQCVFLSINSSFVFPLIENTFVNRVKQTVSFLSGIRIFEKVYRSNLRSLVHELQQCRKSFNELVYVENQTIKYIYIIKQGQFVLEKNIRTDTIRKKGGKILLRNEDYSEDINKLQVRHYKANPYKIIGQGQIVGECEYLLNGQKTMNSMRCHKQGSILYKIGVEKFFQKLFTVENSYEYIMSILSTKFERMKEEVGNRVRINTSNSLILEYMPNKSLKHKQFMSKRKSSVCHSNINHTISEFSSTSHNERNKRNLSGNINVNNLTFFEKFNRIITNDNRSQHRNSFRQRRQHTEPYQCQLKLQARNRSIPAVVQQMVQIVNLKSKYHRIRNQRNAKLNIFQFHTQNVPRFIKNKYRHLSEK